MRTMNAFRSYLLRDKQNGCQHLYDCLRSGGEMAFALIEIYNGKGWKCKPEDIPALIVSTWEKLEADPDKEKENTEEEE